MVAVRQFFYVAFDADTYTIAIIRVKYGGLGLCLPTDVALPACHASTAISMDLIDLMFFTNSYLHEDAKKAHCDSTLFPVTSNTSTQFETLIRSKCDAILAHSGQHRRHAYCRHPPSLATHGFLRSTQHLSSLFSLF